MYSEVIVILAVHLFLLKWFYNKTEFKRPFGVSDEQKDTKM